MSSSCLQSNTTTRRRSVTLWVVAITLCSCGQQQGSDADAATADLDVAATTDAATHDAATPSDVSTQNDTAARSADTFAPP